MTTAFRGDRSVKNFERSIQNFIYLYGKVRMTLEEGVCLINTKNIRRPLDGSKSNCIVRLILRYDSLFPCIVTYKMCVETAPKAYLLYSDY